LYSPGPRSRPRAIRRRPAAPRAALRCGSPEFGSDGRIGAKWNAATATIAYGRPAKDGHDQAFIADADGGRQRRVAFPAWRDDRHQLAAAWHPAGAYLVLLVERDEHERSSRDAIPGYGAYTDYWLASYGARAWKLYGLPEGYDHAITPRRVLARRQQVRRDQGPQSLAGAYTFKIADFVADPEPHLENVRGIVPGNVEQGGEVESIAGDNKTIAFYSTYVTKNLFASRIYTMDIDSSVIRELTHESFAQAPTFTPDGKSIVYMSGVGADMFPLSCRVRTGGS
jgi:WD40-like Beta Propeller Repeat